MGTSLFLPTKMKYVGKNLCGGKFLSGFLPTFILIYGQLSCVGKYFKYFADIVYIAKKTCFYSNIIFINMAT